MVLRDEGTQWQLLALMLGLGAFAAGLAARSFPDALKVFGARPAATAVVAALVCIPPLLWLLGFFFMPLLSTRNILWAASGPILVWAVAIGSIPRRLQRLLAASALVGSLLLSLFHLGLAPPRDNWSAANRAAAKLIQPGDVMFICPSPEYGPFRFAAKKPIGVPVLGFVGEDLRLLDPSYAASPEWSKRLHDLYSTQSSFGIATVGSESGRAWLIRKSNVCSEQEAEDMLKPHGAEWRPVWRQGFLEILVATPNAATETGPKVTPGLEHNR